MADELAAFIREQKVKLAQERQEQPSNGTVGTYNDEDLIMLQSGFVCGVRINVCRQGRNI